MLSMAAAVPARNIFLRAVLKVLEPHFVLIFTWTPVPASFSHLTWPILNLRGYVSIPLRDVTHMLTTNASNTYHYQNIPIVVWFGAVNNTARKRAEQSKTAEEHAGRV